MKLLLRGVCLAMMLVVSANPSEGQSEFTKEHPFNVDGYNHPPQRTKTVVPSYPANARAGDVILRVKIDPEGHVNAVTVVRALAGATDAAVSAVLQWEYTPSKLNGEPIWVIMTISVPSPWRDVSVRIDFDGVLDLAA